MAEPAADNRQGSDAPAAPADTGTSIYDLISDKDTTKGLADIQRRKLADERQLFASEGKAVAEDRTLARNFLSREGAAQDDIKPWNQKAEAERYRTDPIESFGSLASVFAIAASAFTRQPMINAMNGAAAAMNAARDRNDKEYDRAYQAWKDNNELAIKRHQMMHSNYVDALSLMREDVTLGDAKLRQYAAQYGDEQALMLLDHGYAPQLIEMMQSRAKAMEGIQQVLDNSQAHDFRMAAWKAWQKQNGNAPDAVKFGVFTTMMGADKLDPDRQWSQMWFATHKFPEDGDQKKYFDDYALALRQHNIDKYPYRGQPQFGSKNALIISHFNAIKKANPDMDDDAVLSLATTRAEAESTKRTEGAARQETADAKSREYQSDGVPKTEADARAQRWVKMETAAPSGNRVDQLRGRADQIKYATERVNEIEAMLKRHKAITGLGGKVLGRPTEIMGNILGSNSTDYKQFERTIGELQLLMPRILTDSSGRPLGVEAGHIGQVVAGLNAGDTLVGTVRAYEELKKQLAEMSADTEKRIRGGGDDVRLPTNAAPAASSGSRWQSAPVVQ